MGSSTNVGRAFPAFQQVLSKGPQAPRASWFRLSWQFDSRAGSEPAYVAFEGHRQPVSLHHDEPVAGYVTQVMSHWLGRGADG